MSILIKGMEMPKNCWECQLQEYGNCFANGDRPIDKSITADSRDDSCPLVPVPPHGRLIDADALMESDGDAWDGMWGYSGVEIMNAPTIIPASEEVYDKYTDTAGNLHWTGTHSGKHIVKAGVGEA